MTGPVKVNIVKRGDIYIYYLENEKYCLMFSVDQDVFQKLREAEENAENLRSAEEGSPFPFSAF